MLFTTKVGAPNISLLKASLVNFFKSSFIDCCLIFSKKTLSSILKVSNNLENYFSNCENINFQRKTNKKELRLISKRIIENSYLSPEFFGHHCSTFPNLFFSIQNWLSGNVSQGER